jgi:hypothetical protein
MPHHCVHKTRHKILTKTIEAQSKHSSPDTTVYLSMSLSQLGVFRILKNVALRLFLMQFCLLLDIQSKIF